MTYQINMTEGPVFTKLLKFSIPLILSSLLQLLFNAADIIVVGRFAGDNSLAAVGSTSSLINLLVNLFVGLSIGSNVVAAHYFGAEKNKELSDTVHTSIYLGLFSGIILTVIGVIFAKQILLLMQSPFEVLVKATTYLQIYFAGITSTMVYNFGSALLRAKGDTRRPLNILLFSGLINLVLNLIFVIPLKMDVAGVALATVISQTISAFLVIRILVKENDSFKLQLNNIKINRHILEKIVKIGIPAGLQGIIFSLSNVIIQSSINSFGAIVIAANSAVCNIEGFIYTAMNGFTQASLTFSSQNLGAKKISRIKKIVILSQLIVVIIGFSLSFLTILFEKPLIGIYSKNPQVLEEAMVRIKYVITLYAFCGMMDCMAQSIRGIGHSVMPMIVTLIGACGFRLIWLATVFQIDKYHTPQTVFLSYPISWIITWLTHLVCFIITYRKLSKESLK